MTFTVHGIHNGNPVQVTWRDGRLEGDPDLVRLFMDPVKAFMMIVMYIGVVTALEGDPPLSPLGHCTFTL